MTDYYEPELTYRCRECLDEGFIWTTPPTLPPPSHSTLPNPDRRIPNPYSQPLLKCCEHCSRGIAIESGDWARLLETTRRHKPHPEDVARFRERLRKHPNGNELRERVDRLLGQKPDEPE